MKFIVALAVCAVVGLFASLAVNLPQPSDASQPRQSLLYPRPAPLASLSLAQLERWQVRALSHYRGAWRVHERVAARRPLSRTEWTHRRWYRLASLWTARELGETRETIRLRSLDSMGVREAICYVFGGYCSQALSVVACETGGTFSVYARNGQYENIFQMGYNERRTYGWHTVGSPAIVAARAAYRYFVASGRDWSPWECKP